MKTSKGIYLDYNSTTPLHPAIKEKLLDWTEIFANPSSIHQLGKETSEIIEKARKEILELLDLPHYNLVFTSSGTEANHLAFQFLKEKLPSRKKKVLISSIEHPCILYQIEKLSKLGYEVQKIPVSKNGLVDINFVNDNLDFDTAICSVMLANNETGVIQNLKEISEICKEKEVYFHCDAVQSIGKMELSFSEIDADSFSFSAHKFYGLKGIGALVYQQKPKPIFVGGMQEKELRAGTENILGIFSFVEGLKLTLETQSQEILRLQKLKSKLERELKNLSQNVEIIAENSPRLSNTTCVILKGIPNHVLVHKLSQKGIYISRGAACHSGVWEPSHVLLAMGYSHELAECGVRISMGIFTEEEHILEITNVLSKLLSN